MDKSQFRLKMGHHRARVIEMALMLSENFGQKMSHAAQEKFREYLSLHDLPKVLNTQALRALGYEEDLCHELARFYGFGKKDLGISERGQLEKVIVKIEQLEASLKAQFFQENRKKISSREKHLMQVYETIADIVDTSTFRNEEFNTHQYSGRALGYIMDHPRQILVQEGMESVAQKVKYLEEKIRFFAAKEWEENESEAESQSEILLLVD